MNAVYGSQLDAVMTWEKLCEIEPELIELEEVVRNTKDDGRADWFCAKLVWKRDFYHMLTRLVGWRADLMKDALIRKPEAFELAYDHLVGLLPACRNCGCQPFAS